MSYEEAIEDQQQNEIFQSKWAAQNDTLLPIDSFKLSVLGSGLDPAEMDRLFKAADQLYPMTESHIKEQEMKSKTYAKETRLIIKELEILTKNYQKI